MMYLLVFVGLVSAAAGIALGFFAWHNLRTASRLGRPLSHIAKLRPGFRKVRGKVAALDGVLLSPVTNKQCVYYRLRIYEEKSVVRTSSSLSGGANEVAAFAVGGLFGFLVHKALAVENDRTDSSWSALLEACDCVPLTIDDESGLVEVDPEGAAVVSQTKSRSISNREHQISSRLSDLLLEEFDLDTMDNRGNYRTLHFVEETLLVGAKVTVIGPVKTGEEGDLYFQKAGSPLLISDGAVGKQAREARSRAIGFCVGAGLTLALGLIFFIALLVLLIR